MEDEIGGMKVLQGFAEVGFVCRALAFSARRLDELNDLRMFVMSFEDSKRDSKMNSRALITLIDDDESVRESLPHLLKRFGFEVRAFSSAEEYLASDQVPRTKCLVLDITMPGMSGPDLLDELKRLGWKTSR